MLVPTWMGTDIVDGNQQSKKIAKFPEIRHFFCLHESFLGRHAKAYKFKRTLSENQALLKQKFV